jgi:8-oxo-dGTP pyrophosphatase MutT (NUDIX family)
LFVTETIVPGMNKSQKQQPQQRILLGTKNRGFGTGKYNSFGGKFLHDDDGDGDGGGDDDGDVIKVEETIEECACRELEEETNIKIQLNE